MDSSTRVIPSTASDPAQLAKELRERINPAYAHQVGTESYERRLCAETIEMLLETRAASEQTADLNGDMAEASQAETRRAVQQREQLLTDLKRITPVMVRVSKTTLERVPVYPADEVDAAIAKAQSRATHG